MTQRESSGLPLRAMVMVLLFLGVVFLLVALQAVGSGDDSDGSTATAITSVTSTPATTTSSSSAAPAPKADVRVFNISEVAGAAENTAVKLRDAKWNVTEVGNLTLENVPSTTVYYGDASGEKQAAEAVGKLLNAPVDRRRPELAEQPPGVIVAVTG